MFVDAHCHLDDKYFDVPASTILQRAREAGVDQLVVVGCGVEASENAVRLAQAHPGEVFAAVGVHPHDAEGMTDDDFETLRALASLDVVVAVGETGLDYHYDHSPREVQRQVFRRFLSLAKEVQKPVVVHTREAEEDTVRILQEAGPFPRSGQIHCFTGTMDLASPAVDLGLYVSFSGVVTFNSADTLRACAKELPLERLLIETDCPYLTPAPFRGRKNEPMFVSVVAGCIAEQRGLTVDEVARATSVNARLLFELPDPEDTELLAFASGRTLHVAVHRADRTSAELLEAANRVPTKKVRQVRLWVPDDAQAHPPHVEAVTVWAESVGCPVVHPDV